MFARINSMGLLGVDGFMVDVEADLSQGLPGFDVVGLPGAAVKESRDRVRAAMKTAASPIRSAASRSIWHRRISARRGRCTTSSPARLARGQRPAECAGGRQRFRQGNCP